MGLEDANRLTRLHQHGLVVLQMCEGVDHRIEGFPVSCCLAVPAINDKFLGVLCHRRVKVVVKHSKGGLLLPALSSQLRSGCCL